MADQIDIALGPLLSLVDDDGDEIELEDMEDLDDLSEDDLEEEGMEEPFLTF